MAIQLFKNYICGVKIIKGYNGFTFFNTPVKHFLYSSRKMSRQLYKFFCIYVYSVPYSKKRLALIFCVKDRGWFIGLFTFIDVRKSMLGADHADIHHDL